MKKRVLLVLLALALVVSLVAFAACAKEEEVVTEEWEWPERLLVTAMSTRSPIYSAFVAWTTPWSADTGVTVRVIAESDSRLQQIWVKEGRFFTVAPHQARSMMYGLKGQARRDWGPWLSAIWMPAGGVYWGCVTLADSGIETIYDIKPGMSAIVITLAEEPQQSIYAFLAWAQVDPEDITFVPLGATAQQARFLQDGKGDFSLCYYTTPTWLEVEASPHGLRWLPLDAEKDPEGAARFLEVYPWTGWGVATGGIPSSEGVAMALTISPYITRFDTDPELVYRIVKWVDENYDRIKEHPWCAAMTLENLLDVAVHNYEPIHDGSVRYLEEKGLWTEELEARRQYNIELLTLWVDSYQTAISMADERGIDVNVDNEEWQEFWDKYKKDHDLPMLVNFQGPGKEQPSYSDFYENWEEVRPKW